MEAIIVYFIIFLVISSLLKRLTQAQSKAAGGAESPARSPSQPVPQRPESSSEGPSPVVYPLRAPQAREARASSVARIPDERGTRRMSIAERIREEIERAAAERMPEQGRKPNPSAQKPIQPKPKAPVREAIRPKPIPLSASRKKVLPMSPLALRFDPRSVRQGIIFSEILGPPRAERF